MFSFFYVMHIRVLSACKSAYHTCAVPVEATEAVRFPWTGVTSGVVCHYVGPLEGQSLALNH